MAGYGRTYKKIHYIVLKSNSRLKLSFIGYARTTMIIFLIVISLDVESLYGLPNGAEEKQQSELDRDGSFIAYSDGTIIDTEMQIMWAAFDNGFPIDWGCSKLYCSNFRLGGYSDWRMPTLQELEKLYTPSKKNVSPSTFGCSGGYLIHHFFHITCCCLWAAENNGKRPAAFPFITVDRFWHHQTKQSGNRILPVRNISQ